MFAVHRTTASSARASQPTDMSATSRSLLVKQHLVYLSMVIGLAALGGGGCGAFGGNGGNGVTSAPQAVPANSFVRAWQNDLKLGKDPVDEMHLRGDTLF